MVGSALVMALAGLVVLTSAHRHWRLPRTPTSIRQACTLAGVGLGFATGAPVVLIAGQLFLGANFITTLVVGMGIVFVWGMAGFAAGVVVGARVLQAPTPLENDYADPCGGPAGG